MENFLEAVKQLVARFDKGGMTNDEFQVKLAKLIEFYSQPFKPEMIELFEGVYKMYWIEQDYYSDNFPERDVDGDTYWRSGYKWFTEEEKDERLEKTKDYGIGQDGANSEVTITSYNVGTQTIYKTNEKNVPQTLNDFISDCQRAGISLEWKKEMADKYFGGVK